MHLKSLHLAVGDLELDRSTVLHLRSLTRLHVEGFLTGLDIGGFLQSSSTAEQLWSILTAANVHLQDITVWHLSKPLLDYLQTYSSLQILHVKLIYQPNSWTEFDGQAFMQQILPLHKVSPEFSVLFESDPPPANEGLLFARHPPTQVLAQWDVTVCVESVPHCLPLLVRFHTFPSVFYWVKQM